jgi:hypothetical protein
MFAMLASMSNGVVLRVPHDVPMPAVVSACWQVLTLSTRPKKGSMAPGF